MESGQKGPGARLKQRSSSEETGTKSPAERGLCEKCARFNWDYHLTRYIKGIERNKSFLFEDSHVDQIIRIYNETPRSQFLNPGDGWCCIEGVPYSGSYKFHSDKSSAKIEFGPCHSSDLIQSNCSLCGLIFDAIKAATLDPWASDTETSFRLRRLNTLDFMISQIDLVFTDPNQDVIYDPPVLTVTLHLQSNTAPHQLGFSFAFIDFETGPSVHSMINPHQIEFPQVKHWLKTCKSEHGDHCKPERQLNVLNFKVVDVWTERVVVGPAGCTYIALSYVWGSTQPFRVQKADLISHQDSLIFSERVYARLVRQKLPQTIQDAMFVVKSLGERYLWVDSLCIVEDDEVEMKAMIHAMDSIYKAAALTIIAATGDDADFGLPGLYPGSRSIQYATRSIEGISLVSTERKLQLSLSPWAKRGWTYQEYHFSTRKLVFINQRVFFECAGLVFGEATPLQGVRGSGKIRLFDNTSPRSYYSHVQEYTRRNLTFESDILNAFTAILQDHSARFGTKFCWGLPTEHFTEALMWTNGPYYEKTSSSLKRRTGSQKDCAAFPSWSWAGWIGQVHYDYHDQATSFGHKITSDIVWPWDPEYSIDFKERDVFKNGILSIDVRFATFDRSQLSYLDALYCQSDSATDWTCGTQQCFFLARITTEAETWDNECIPRSHILMAVEQDSSGIYYRTGLFRVREACWTAAKIERKRILLG
jgi:hypothetical protein